MKIMKFLLSMVLLFAFILVSCESGISSSALETTCIPQTKEASRIVHSAVAGTESKATIAPTKSTIPSLSFTIQAGTSSVELDPAYFDGIIVLTKYYTLLDHGLYEEVLPLYSSSLLERTAGRSFETDIKSVKVISIHPYDYWCAQSGWPLQSIPKNEIRYIVGTIVFHKAAAWNMGGTPRPDNQTRFVSLILENGEWKLNEFNSSPWFP